MKCDSKNKKHCKLITFLLIDMLIIAGLVLYFGILRPYNKVNPQVVKMNGTYLSQPTAISRFNLTDQNNHSFTQKNLKGHWTMMFFGFTSCPKICPVTLVAMKNMYLQLEKQLPQDELPQVVFVTVDPDVDTTKRLKEYVSSFHQKFIGARADIQETIKLENQLHIVAAKMQLDGQGKDRYTINHSTEILLFNPAGQLQAYFSYPHEADKLVKDYVSIINLNRKIT